MYVELSFGFSAVRLKVIHRAERGDQNCDRIFVAYFPIFSGNLFYSFSAFQNLGKITDI